ncbi:hypothetical protein GDO81_007330 [Engystomops pustulosus]|uniref:G-protein coupled receptors family 1 profile domain-containing protein n=1 Tax=Engystomops pustulosus TaxID=76066 RepID=A0AAV7C6G0_ENGPU|nr:hypothetical protein GDO81_007330 [Engystomops pustulosus]
MERPNYTSVTEFIFLSFAKCTRFPVLIALVLFLLYLLIVCVNILMILVIKFDTRLHTPMYFFVFILACLDICYTTTIIPQVLYNLLGSRPSIIFANCATQMFCSVIFGAMQILIITAMAYDRYVAISNPLRYKTVMNWAACTMLLFTAFILGFCIGVIVVYAVFKLPFCRAPEITHFYCAVGEVLLLTCIDVPGHRAAEVTTYLIGLGLFTIPFLFMMTSYMYIINAILKIRTTEGRQKAFSTCSSHITVVVVEYGCLGFIYFRPSTEDSLDKEKIFVMIFTYLSPILNPVIYSIRNNAVKEGFKKLKTKII